MWLSADALEWAIMILCSGAVLAPLYWHVSSPHADHAHPMRWLNQTLRIRWPQGHSRRRDSWDSTGTIHWPTHKCWVACLGPMCIPNPNCPHDKPDAALLAEYKPHERVNLRTAKPREERESKQREYMDWFQNQMR